MTHNVLGETLMNLANQSNPSCWQFNNVCHDSDAMKLDKWCRLMTKFVKTCSLVNVTFHILQTTHI